MLEGLVCGERVAASVRGALPLLPAPRLEGVRLPPAPDGAAESDAAAAESDVRRLMWEKVGLVRSRDGLSQALARFDALARQPLEPATLRLVTVARLVATAALARTESRGAHFRSDHPATSPAWRRRLVLSPDGPGVRVETEAVAAPEVVEACA